MKKQLLIIIVLSASFLGFMGMNMQTDRWLAPQEAKSIKNPISPSNQEASAIRGKKIFKTRCMICHGISGKGDGPGGKALNPKPQNLTLPMVKSQTDGEIFWKVTNGRNAMIKWGPILSENERWDVVNYVRSLE
tara:strand:- start:266554 stop:266955 length:402 start_codon:yes stop_codon:yes gene_type:complete